MKNKVIKRSLHCIIILIVLLSSLNSYSKDLKIDFSEITGDWLIKEYKDKIVKSKSPIKSGVSGYPEYFYIKKEKGKYYWNLISGFHDGIGPVELYQIKHDQQNVYDLILLYADGKDTVKNKWIITFNNAYKSITILGEPFNNYKNVYIKINEGLKAISEFLNKYYSYEGL